MRTNQIKSNQINSEIPYKNTRSQVSHKRVKTSFSSRIYLHNKRSKMQAVKQKGLVFCVNDASHILFLIVKWTYKRSGGITIFVGSLVGRDYCRRCWWYCCAWMSELCESGDPRSGTVALLGDAFANFPVLVVMVTHELSLCEGNFVGLPFVLSFLFSLNFYYISS